MVWRVQSEEEHAKRQQHYEQDDEETEHIGDDLPHGLDEVCKLREAPYEVKSVW